MRHPHLYRIGIDNTCFGIGHFVRWVIYALFHAFMVYIVNFYAVVLPGMALVDGKDYGFWVVGHVVYGVCVVVANVVITFKFNNYSGWGEVLAFGSSLCYFTLFFLENLLKIFPELYLIFDTTYRQPMVWIAGFLSIGIVSFLEMMWHRIRYFELCCSRKAKSNQLEYNSYELDGLIDNGPKQMGVEMQLLGQNQTQASQQKPRMSNNDFENEWRTS